MKTPNVPDIDAAEVFVTTPPSARSMPAPFVPVATMVPLFVTVPDARYLT